MQTRGYPKVLDVFATRPDVVLHAASGHTVSTFSKDWDGTGGSNTVGADRHELDEVFVASVMNVYIDPVTAANSTTRKAVITTDATEYVMWAFPKDGADYYIANTRMDAVKQGDLVRIGHAPTGSEDYLTVVDKFEAPILFNSLGSAVPTALSGNSLASGGDTSASPFTGAGRVVLRLSKKVQLTAIPTPFYTNTSVATTSNVQVTTANRHTGQFDTKYRNDETSDYSSDAWIFTNTFKDFLYPLYHCIPAPVEFTVKFDHTLKDIQGVSLMAYSLEAKSQVDAQNADILPIDDYFILQIKEIQGDVVSNHSHAHRAFAVLPTGGLASGARTFHNAQYPEGLANQTVSMKHVSSLTFKLTDRRGSAAKVGRVHLWLRLLTLHG